MTLHPKIIDLTLDRVWRLLAALDHPERRLPPVIHAAGTNGKGSTLAFLRAMFEADSKRVHAYSSPHLVRFHERICLGGTLIDEGELQAVLTRCEAANGPDTITYFEITTVAALLAFSEVPADVLLLETGLGGRLDATNVIDKPALTLITSISRDHMQFLGDTLVEIAGEKAGIMKPGVLCLSAPQPPEVAQVLAEKAAKVGCELRFIAPLGSSDGLALPGDHQRTNAALAQAAAEHMGLPAAAMTQGLASAKWPARFQQLSGTSWNQQLPDGVELWLDGGHNAAAGRVIAKHAADHWAAQPLHVIYGLLNTKEAAAFLAPIAGVATSLSAIAIPDADASLTAEQAAEAVPGAMAYASLAEALAQVTKGRVLICGSLYLAGWVLAAG